MCVRTCFPNKDTHDISTIARCEYSNMNYCDNGHVQRGLIIHVLARMLFILCVCVCVVRFICRRLSRDLRSFCVLGRRGVWDCFDEGYTCTTFTELDDGNGTSYLSNSHHHQFLIFGNPPSLCSGARGTLLVQAFKRKLVGLSHTMFIYYSGYFGTVRSIGRKQIQFACVNKRFDRLVSGRFEARHYRQCLC